MEIEWYLWFGDHDHLKWYKFIENSENNEDEFGINFEEIMEEGAIEQDIEEIDAASSDEDDWIDQFYHQIYLNVYSFEWDNCIQIKNDKH